MVNESKTNYTGSALIGTLITWHYVNVHVVYTIHAY